MMEGRVQLSNDRAACVKTGLRVSNVCHLASSHSINLTRIVLKSSGLF
jgi:hypothetical protein